jgi:ATP adenylyltransferase
LTAVKIILEPGTLRGLADRASRRALESGALLPVDTVTDFIEDGGMRFVVRIVSSFARKHRALRALDADRPAATREENPFLPYDEDLFVTDLSSTHLCILNKYNVIDHHMLVVTREYEDQEELLTEGDFVAACACLREFDSLVFYNGGRAAGASQPHRHLQVIPLPMTPESPGLPFDRLVEQTAFRGSLGAIPCLPFRHSVAPFEAEWVEAPERTAPEVRARYGEMLRAVGMRDDLSPGARQSHPYDLLVTPKWMYLVPRSRESWRSIPVNSLGFAGSLLARDEDDLETIRSSGPMNILREVAEPRL